MIAPGGSSENRRRDTIRPSPQDRVCVRRCATWSHRRHGYGRCPTLNGCRPWNRCDCGRIHGLSNPLEHGMRALQARQRTLLQGQGYEMSYLRRGTSCHLPILSSTESQTNRTSITEPSLLCQVYCPVPADGACRRVKACLWRWLRLCSQPEVAVKQGSRRLATSLSAGSEPAR